MDQSVPVQNPDEQQTAESAPPEEPIKPEEPQTAAEEPRKPSGLFKKYITDNKIFRNREVLRHSYNPRELPHRDDQIDSIAEILAPALQGATPSNILIYGKTGTGKTATVKYVGGELENESSEFARCRLVHLNCETIDTQYRVLAQIANHVSGVELKPSDRKQSLIPPTGWHTDQVYSELKNILEHTGGLQIIVLDEIDKLVKKSGDDTLYSLTRINSDLKNARVCIIGISNDLTFKDFLDPRVLSSLSEEELVFPPYDANQLRDILYQRAKVAFIDGAVSDDVISLCAARAAQEHGDARRALDLLRVSGELAEREGAEHVEERHVVDAQDKIDDDTMSECIRTLPIQSKIVLSSMLVVAGSGQKVFTTSHVMNVYRDLTRDLDIEALSARRVSDLINDLSMLGIVSTHVISFGRHGRTTEIYFKGPTNDIRKVIMNEPRFAECERMRELARGN
ncbi:MAG TPA: ORC1-type DNA replication protein [Methanocorpusculum sp.]|nr:ORC1-type DNA replication protein [Methanocorpusculum sp.]